MDITDSAAGTSSHTIAKIGCIHVTRFAQNAVPVGTDYGNGLGVP